MKSGNLAYRDGTSWKPLSGWMRSFLDFGRILAQFDVPDARMVIGVSVPTRAFAAVLAGAGVVMGKAVLEQGPSRSAAKHFNYLASLPEGTSVAWYTPRAKKKVGRIAGVREYDGRRLLMIQTQSSAKGGLKESCDERDCLGVQPLAVDVPLPPGNEKGKALGTTVPFLANLLPSESLFRLLSENANDCLILGARRLLVAEAESGELCVLAPSEACGRTGTIASILRIRDPHRPSETYRTVVTSDPKEIKDSGVVIYDGARPYLKFRQRWRRRPTMLILDRSDPRAGDASETMNEEYLTKRIPGWEPPEIDIPDGVEITVYAVRVAP